MDHIYRSRYNLYTAVAAIQVSEFQKQGGKNWGRGVRAVKRETIDWVKREPTMEFALIDT